MFGFELELWLLATTSVFGLATILLFYWFSTRNQDYWKKHGIPFVKPLPLLGSLYDYFKKPAQEVEKDHYFKYGTIYGYYEGNKPGISVGDPKLLREILVKDFSTFHSRRVFVSGNEIFDKMVSNMKGDDDWKRLRTIISPTFTTGKIKRMLGILKDSSMTVVKNFQIASLEGKPIDAKKLYGAFTIDVIASAAFSTKIDSHNDPENQFVKYAKKVFQQTLNFRTACFIICPPLAKLLKVTFFPPDVLEFYMQTTLQIIEERKKTGQTRNDFLQLLMDTAKEISEEEKMDLPEKESDIASNYSMQEDTNPQTFKNKKNLTMDEIVAQCVSFFLAGYDTTASTLSFASYLLALNPHIQERLRTEVDEAIKTSNGEFNYETIQSMTYLDNVISETLRLFPPLIRLERTAFSDYKLGDNEIPILKDMLVSIPICAIHRDPKFYPAPEKFEPERFTPEERAKRDPYVYLPFGAGPRNCVAMRFALMEVKVCLAYVIANFIIKRCPETKVPLEFGLGQVLVQPNGIILEMETRKDSTSLV